MKRIFAVVIAVLFYSLALFDLGIAAEEERTALPKKPAVPAKLPGMSNFSIIMGSISKIDVSDPAKPKLEVKSDMDNTVHTIEMTPWTNVSKVTDISELKSGDTVRIAARKAEGKEIAITILFGNIKNIPTARPTFKGQAPMQEPISPTKQEAAKKY
ncbi:MAG: hypothetical protein HZA30_01505 [Candidatus Omnitrophica bacterium]|nr:hypothetical protein [Candidatus Omnitrophota bacterium]